MLKAGKGRCRGEIKKDTIHYDTHHLEDAIAVHDGEQVRHAQEAYAANRRSMCVSMEREKKTKVETIQ